MEFDIQDQATSLLTDLIKTQRDDLFVLLEQIGKNDNARKRMIFQFKDPELEKIVRLIAKDESKYMISYKNNILDHQKKKHLLKSPYSEVKTVIWEIILGYLFVENQSYYKKNSFLQHINKKMTAKYNIDHTTMLNTLSLMEEEGLKFINQLNTFINETPKGIIQETEALPEDKHYRKLGGQVTRDYLDPIFINNSGLIILAPYLEILFERCGLMEKSIFKNDASNYKAIQLLSYAATGESDQEEHALVINKVLCGLNVATPIDTAITITAVEKDTVDDMLKAITQQWKPLNASTIDSLRVSFLQRDGKLEEETDQFYLKVEQKPYDMLLGQIPWNISKIKLSFMKKILEVEWKT